MADVADYIINDCRRVHGRKRYFRVRIISESNVSETVVCQYIFEKQLRLYLYVISFHDYYAVFDSFIDIFYDLRDFLVYMIHFPVAVYDMRIGKFLEQCNIILAYLF